MLVRLIVGCALACGLVASSAVASAGSASGMFKGKTAQGHPIKLVVKKRAFRIHAFEIDLRCRDGSTLVLEEGGFLWTKTKSGGSFRDSQFGKTDSVYFRGHASARRIHGQIRVTDKEKRKPKCASRWVTFNATPR